MTSKRVYPGIDAMATKELERTFPKIIFLLSGKRKSGKDYIAARIQERFDSTIILRLSGPLKLQYAKENGLDYEKLLDASSYKETYREDMIRWGEEIRRRQPDYFCRHAIEQSEAWTKSIWVVSDARRLTDIASFKDLFGGLVKCIRVSAHDETRRTRGWAFTKGVDDVESECGLDDFNEWDYEIVNEESQDITLFLDKIASLVV